MHGQNGADPTPPAGVVELREDVPLAGGGGGGGGGARCAGGPRLISGCFAVLSVSITVALLTQMYYGEYEVVPHGSVSSSAAECSRAGTDALKAGGRALDAAVAAALCLAVVAPHRTSLDASGSMLYWEYRRGRGRGPGGSQLVELAEWGAPGGGTGVPRLVAALATLHARLGALSWARVVQPAVQLARTGYNVSEGLASALAARAEAVPVGSLRTAPLLALYLATLQRNTSAELASAWGGAGALRVQSAAGARAGRWRVWAGGAGGGLVAGALAAALHPAPPDAAAARDRNQESGESIDEYVTVLKNLAQRCEFEHLEDSLVRDRIVCGVNNERLRDRLLRTEDLTLDRAVKICQANEITQEEMLQIECTKKTSNDVSSASCVDVVKQSHGAGRRAAGATSGWRPRARAEPAAVRRSLPAAARPHQTVRYAASRDPEPESLPRRLCARCASSTCDSYNCPARRVQCFFV